MNQKALNTENYESDEDEIALDTDRDILESVVKTKYWDNFNVTIDDTVLTQRLDNETETAKNKTITSNEGSNGIFNQVTFFTGNYKDNKRVNDLVTSLSKDLNISEEKAFRQLLAKNQIASCDLDIWDKSQTIPPNLDTLAPIICQDKKKKRKTKRKKSSSKSTRRGGSKSTSVRSRSGKTTQRKRVKSKNSKTMKGSTIPSSSFKDIPYNTDYGTINQSIIPNDDTHK